LNQYSRRYRGIIIQRVMWSNRVVMLSTHLCSNICAKFGCAGIPIVKNVDDTDGRLKHFNQSPKMISMVMADHDHFQAVNAIVSEEGMSRRPCRIGPRIDGDIEAIAWGNYGVLLLSNIKKCNIEEFGCLCGSINSRLGPKDKQ
jgi:hypothetical protein